MRDIKTIADANVVCRELQDQIRLLTANTVDFRGRRIRNAGRSEEISDYVTRQELLDLASEVNIKLTELKSNLDFLEKRVKALEP